MAFLHGEKGFNEDRVRNGLKRMDKAKGKTNQVAKNSTILRLKFLGTNGRFLQVC